MAVDQYQAGHKKCHSLRIIHQPRWWICECQRAQSPKVCITNATSGTPAEEKHWLIVNLFSINHPQRGRKHIQGWNGPICHRLLMSGLSHLD